MKSPKKTIIEIHEDVSADHYDQGFTNNSLQRFWHKQRIKQIRKVIPADLGICLDIGCHAGLLTEHILQSSNFRKLRGIDVSKEAIKKAQQRIKKGSFLVADAHNLPFKDCSFDMVLCLEVLEHVSDPEKVLAEINRVLKKNGTAIILVPTDSLLFRTVWFLWNLVNPVWKHTHIQSFKANSLEKLLRKNKLKIVRVKKFNLGMLELVVATK